MEEVEFIRKNLSHIVIKYAGEKIRPHGFTREGCNMLATILGSDIAIERCIQIIRIFSTMEAEVLLSRQAGMKSAGQITGERFDMSVKRFKVALEAVKLMGITTQAEAREIANDITRDTTGVDLMAFILPYCSRETKPVKSKTPEQKINDNEEKILSRFVSAWWEKYGDNAVDSAHLYDLITDTGIPLELGNGDKKSRKIRLGKMLSKLNSQQVGSFIITDAGKHRSVRLWKLKPAEKSLIDS